MTVNLLENVVLAVVVVRKQDEHVELNLGTGVAAGTGRIAGNANPPHPLPNPCQSSYPALPPAWCEAMPDADADRSGTGRSRLRIGAFGSLARSASRSFAGRQRVARQQPQQTPRQTPWVKGHTRATIRTGCRRTGNLSVSG